MPKQAELKSTGKGSLIIIGGREDKEKGMAILRAFCQRLPRNAKLCIATVASQVGDELWDIYRKAFKKIGIKNVTHLSMVDRREAVDREAMKAVDGADGLFFTGGDQLKITSELGGTPVLDKIFELYNAGGVIGGTSAGASVMSETMLVGGVSNGSVRLGQKASMAPGLGLVKNMIIDQHFAERGRISRLMAAVALNPKFLGIGIDEDTAVVMDGAEEFHVIGAGAVYIIDAHEATGSNVSESDEDATLSFFNVKVHVLSEGDKFDVFRKEPQSRPSPRRSGRVRERRRPEVRA